MDWRTLYSPRRGIKDDRKKEERIPGRSPYQRDYDRLIFSSPFRRLQNKTQVFPLPVSIFVHNRLTHSLEVASVGRSLGALAGNRIYEKYKGQKDLPEDFTDFYRYDLSNVIAAACLAHDIGNPPFGHSGEKAIGKYFTDNAEKSFSDSGKTLREFFSEKEWNDLVRFEGNANAFRLLTHAFNGRMNDGFSLTFTTLASIVKYPCESMASEGKKRLSRKKFGFFQEEIDTFGVIAQELGLIKTQDTPISYGRHPFVFLTEAADDICYSIIDLEDAHRLKITSYDEVESFLLAFIDEKQELERRKNTLSKIEDTNEKVAFLRAIVIGKLTAECQEAFMKNEDAILSGTYEKSLISDMSETAQNALQRIAEYSLKHIYSHRSVVEVELAGFQVLSGLLEAFVPALLDYEKLTKSEKLLSLIPEQFFTPEKQTAPYQKMLAVLDYISSMTDIYAIELYRRIKGISLPY
jgi:dGTPase